MDLNVILLQYGPYALLAYILLTDVLPKISPEFAKAISKYVSTEDRLFKLLERNSDAGAALAASLTKLESTLSSVNIAVQTLSHRIDNLEAAMKQHDQHCIK